MREGLSKTIAPTGVVEHKAVEPDVIDTLEQNERFRKLLDRAMAIGAFWWGYQEDFEHFFKVWVEGKGGTDLQKKIEIRKLWVEIRAAGDPFKHVLEAHMRRLLDADKGYGFFRYHELYRTLQYTDVSAFLCEALNHKTIWNDNDRSNFSNILDFLGCLGDPRSTPYFTKLLSTLVAHGQKHKWHENMLDDTVRRLKVVAGDETEAVLDDLAKTDPAFGVWFKKQKLTLLATKDSNYWYTKYEPEPFDAELEEKRLKRMEEEAHKPPTQQNSNDYYYDDSDDALDDWDHPGYGDNNDSHYRDPEWHSPPAMESFSQEMLDYLKSRLPADAAIDENLVRNSETIGQFIREYNRHFGAPANIREQQRKITYLKKLFELEILSPSHESAGDPFQSRTRDLKRFVFLIEDAESHRRGDFLEKMRNAHPLVRNIGVGHMDIEEISKQLYDIEKSLSEEGIDVEKLSDAERLMHIVDFLIEKFKKKDCKYDFVPESTRKSNAIAVNTAQEDYLQKEGMRISMPFRTDRNLVLYFREETWRQMDGFLFCFNYLVCKWYVDHSGFSRVLNKVQVVSRLPDQYPKTLHELGLSEQDYLKVRGSDFERKTSMGANTVHFTHGTEHGSQYGSTSILGTATRNDKRKMSSLGMNYIPLPLHYFKDNNEARNDHRLEQKEVDYSADLYGTVRVMVESLRKLEAKMLPPVP